LVAITASTPLYGKLGDMYGRRPVYMVAILITLIGSILSGLSTSMEQLIAFRALQGIGTGGLMVGSQAIMADVVAPRDRGRYIGMLTSVWAGASVGGLVLGGLVVDALSWRWVFFAELPVGAAALALVGVRLHPVQQRRARNVDYQGMALLTICVTAAILLTTLSGQKDVRSSPILALAATVTVTLVAFVWWEGRAAEPVIPRELFRSRVFTGASALGFWVGGSMFGVLVFMPLYLQIVHRASPTQSAVQMLPFMAGVATSSIVGGRLITRIGRYRAIAVGGALLLMCGMGLLTLLDDDTGPVLTGIYMLIIGVSLGTLVPLIIQAVQNTAPAGHLGAATSIATFFRTIGGSFGVAVFGAIFASKLDSGLRDLPPRLADRLSDGVDIRPAEVRALPSDLREQFLGAFADALHHVFLAGVVFGALAFALSWLLRDPP
jgi:EmrB/QacA subfamily drug resistance transporter